MYPKCTLPLKRRKKPKSRKKRMGPARSESSMMCWSIRARGFSTASVYFPIVRLMDYMSAVREEYLALDMPKIHTQLLQQRWFPIITLRSKRRQPTSPQPSLLTHPSTDTPKTSRRTICRRSRSHITISCLRRRGMARYLGR